MERKGPEPPDAREIEAGIRAGVEAGTIPGPEAVICLNAFRIARGLQPYYGVEQDSYTPPEPPDIVA